MMSSVVATPVAVTVTVVAQVAEAMVAVPSAAVPEAIVVVVPPLVVLPTDIQIVPFDIQTLRLLPPPAVQSDTVEPLVASASAPGMTVVAAGSVLPMAYTPGLTNGNCDPSPPFWLSPMTASLMAKPVLMSGDARLLTC